MLHVSFEPSLLLPFTMETLSNPIPKATVKEKCSICDKMIRSLDMKRHIQSIHLDTTRKCDECGKIISSLFFERHVLRMHKNKKYSKERTRFRESINCD